MILKKDCRLRTTLSLEKLNSAMVNQCGQGKPNYVKFFETLAVKNQLASQTYQNFIAGVAPHPKKTKTVTYQERFKDLVIQGYKLCDRLSHIKKLDTALKKFTRKD